MMSLSSVALQKRSGNGKDSRGGGEVVCGAAGGGRGAPLLPCFCPVVTVVLATPLCVVVVAVAVAAVFLGGWADVVTSDRGGPAGEKRR